jgi:hypothetical protein
VGVRPIGYSNRQLVLACLIGSLVAWGMIVIPLAVLQLWDRAFSFDGWQQAGGVVVLLGLFGIPIALLLGFLVGFPAMKLANRLGRNRYRDALAFGAATGLAIALLLLVYSLVDGLSDYFDDSMRGSFGDGRGMLWDNGMPTVRGWLQELKKLVQYAVIGALSGASIRWWLGSPSKIEADAG